MNLFQLKNKHALSSERFLKQVKKLQDGVWLDKRLETQPYKPNWTE